MKARPIHVRPEPALRAALETEAKARGLTLSELIRTLLTAAIMPERAS